MIETIYYRDLVLDEYSSYIRKCLESFKDSNIKESDFLHLLAPIEDKYKKLVSNSGRLQKSTHTEKIKACHKERGERYLCFRFSSEAFIHSKDMEKRKAGNTIMRELKRRGYCMQTFGQVKLSAAIAGILMEYKLDTKFSKAVSFLGLDYLMEDIEEAHESYQQAYKARNSDKAKEPKIKRRDIKRELHSDIQGMCKYISLLSQLSGREAYLDLAIMLNKVSDSFSPHIKSRKTRKRNQLEKKEKKLLESQQADKNPEYNSLLT